MSNDSKPVGQRSAEARVARVERELGPFVVAAETTRMPMVFTSVHASDNPIVFVNDAFLALTGYDQDELLGKSFGSLIENGTDPEALTEIGTAFRGGRGLETPVRYHRKDGRSLWVSIFVSPVRDADGAIVQHFASFVDITAQMEEEYRLRIVLKDLTRRTDEMLSSVLAIARETLRDGADKAAIDAFLERIAALRANAIPYEDEDGATQAVQEQAHI